MENMTENSIPKSTAGQTLISVNEVIAYREQIAALTIAIATERGLNLVKDEQIKNLKDSQAVAFITKGNWGATSTEYRNMDSVIVTITKEVEDKVGKELVTLRRENKSLLTERTDLNDRIEDLEVKQSDLIGKAVEKATENTNNKMEALRVAHAKINDERDELVEKLKVDHSKKEAKFLEQVKELQLQLKDKSEAQKLEQQINDYKSLIKTLTQENDKYRNTGLFARLANKFTSNDDYLKRTNERLNQLLDRTPDHTNVVYRLPENLNQFATKEVYGTPITRNMRTGERLVNSWFGNETESIYENITTVQFKS